MIILSHMQGDPQDDLAPVWRGLANPTRRRMLDLLAEEPLTLREIGESYGISRERVRQIEERVKRKLKDYLDKESPDLRDTVTEAG